MRVRNGEGRAMKIALVTVGMAVAGLAASGHAAGRKSDMREVAQCVVDNDAGDVRKLLATVPGSRAEAAVAVRVLDYYGGCSDNVAASGPISWRDRAELADAALTKRLGRKMPDMTAAAARDGWALTPGKGMSPGVDYNPSAVGVRMLGDCVVRAMPQAALDLLRSQPGSTAEANAISALAPAVAPCVTGGQSFRVKRAELRLLVAEPLYHLVGR